MLQSLKNYSTEKIVSLLLSMATNCSNENLVRMTYLMELIPKKDYYRERIRWFRQMIRDNHPSIEFPRRILRDLHPNQRDKWITNLAVNHLLSGTNKRKAWQESEGYYPPSTVVISPTMRCNLSCYGCYAGDYHKSLELTAEEVDSVLVQMKEMGVYFAVISGGEPFFKEDIFDIFAKHSDMAFLVFTHGGLIDERIVERLIEVGNVMPAFSLEGFEQETDERRGPGHFQKVMRAMDLLREAKLSFCGAFTQTSKNTDIITSEAYIDMLLDKGCFALWLFSYVPVGRKPDLTLMPTPEQRDLMRRRTMDFRATKPIVMVDFWNDGPIINGCIAGGRKYFHVNANGDIEPCVFCHFAVDNIRRTTLREALKSPLFNKIRARQGERKTCCVPACSSIIQRRGASFSLPLERMLPMTAPTRFSPDWPRQWTITPGGTALIADDAWEKEFRGEQVGSKKAGTREK